VENECVNGNGKYFVRSVLEGAVNVTTVGMGLEADRKDDARYGKKRWPHRGALNSDLSL
jgi:hypothetical protein